MHTFNRFKTLTEQQYDKAKSSSTSSESGDYHLSDYAFEAASLARINGMAACLNINPEVLLSELLAAALGDAHDGFLAAFSDQATRVEANSVLKQTVKELHHKYQNK